MIYLETWGSEVVTQSGVLNLGIIHIRAGEFPAAGADLCTAGPFEASPGCPHQMPAAPHGDNPMSPDINKHPLGSKLPSLRTANPGTCRPLCLPEDLARDQITQVFVHTDQIFWGVGNTMAPASNA